MGPRAPQDSPRRRGAASDQPPLERHVELRAIARTVAAVDAGAGELVVVTGPAGAGKSTLLRAIVAEADQRDMLGLRARCSELESGLALGVVRALVERPLLERASAERERLLAGPASPLRSLLDPASATPVESWSAIAHGLSWTLARLAQDRPLGVVIDDLHWADEASSRALAYVARRLEGHPILLAIAVRNDAADAIDWPALARAERATVLCPAPLSRDATADVVARVLPSAGLDPGAGDAVFAAACHRLTGGNPQLLVALLAGCRDAGIAPSPDGVARLQGVTPAAVSRIVVDRLTRLGPEAVAVAHAVAVLEEASWELALALSGVPEADATTAVDRLVAAEILADVTPLRFAHPLARAAVVADLSRPVRDRAHRRAARLLAPHDPETAAQHLLRGRPGQARWAARTLEAAARAARKRGVPWAAVALLERALREQPSTETRVALAEALLAAGDPRASVHLERAIDDAPGPADRARLAVMTGQAQFVAGEIPRAIATMRRGLEDADQIGDPALVDDLATTFAVLASDDALLRERVMAHAQSRTGDPRLEAVRALDGFSRGRPVSEVVPQARAGLATLYDARGDDGLPMFHLAIWALAGCDEVDAADAALEEVFARARDRGSRVTYGVACFMRSWVRWRRGDLPGMLADAEETLVLAADGWGVLEANAHWIQAEVALLRDDEPGAGAAVHRGLQAAERTQWGLSVHWLLATRSALRLRQGDPAGALDDALGAGALATRHFSQSPAVYDWRGRAIRAALALAQPDRARALAADGLARAEAFGAPRTLALARRNAALCAAGSARIAGLEAAAEFAAAGPSPLVRAEILLDLGVALRRDRRRADARAPLRQAADLARQSGATGVAAAAQAELQATGARPRRFAAWGPEALTPREHELARLAAQGLGNTEIAARLFITRKTVESHLSAIYRKLEIDSRSALPDALVSTSSPGADACAPSS